MEILVKINKIGKVRSTRLGSHSSKPGLLQLILIVFLFLTYFKKSELLRLLRRNSVSGTQWKKEKEFHA